MNLIPYEYAYLAGSLYFVPIWALLFFRMPEYRYFMVVFGLSYMWLGLAAEYFFWTKDWWYPLTITGTRIGLEDLIMCFTHVGIPIFIYDYISGKRLEPESGESWFQEGARRFLFFCLFLFAPLIVLFYIFSVHSFLSTLAGFLIAGCYVIFQRKDLLIPAIATSFLLVLFTFPVYFLGHLSSPGVIQKIWDAKMSAKIILGYPLEDMVWYAALGFLMGGLYPYVSGRKLVKTGKNNLKTDWKSVLIIARRFIKGEKLD